MEIEQSNYLVAFATSRAQSAWLSRGRAILPFSQMLRGISEQTIGVAPFARVSATYLCRYQPKVWTVCPSRSSALHPCPVRAPVRPLSLCPNCIMTMSPGFSIASTISQ